jgi:hypothetical protein
MSTPARFHPEYFLKSYRRRPAGSREMAGGRGGSACYGTNDEAGAQSPDPPDAVKWLHHPMPVFRKGAFAM